MTAISGSGEAATLGGPATPSDRRLALRWPWVAAALYIGLNLAVLPFTVAFRPDMPDWDLFTQLPQRLADGTVYSVDRQFVWSPVMAWIMAAVSYVGYWPWVALHVATLMLLRSPLLILLAACSWAFWIDAASAHTTTFVFVAGALALSGSRPGAIAYLALCLLMPRPVQLPLAVWLLWRDRSLIRPGLVLGVLYTVVVLASGYAVEWVTTALAFSADQNGTLGPVRYFGMAWLLVGVPLGVLFLLKGRVAWAGLVITPYVLAHYLLFLLWEIVGRGGPINVNAAQSDAEA
jgi:hypothetical protein